MPKRAKVSREAIFAAASKSGEVVSIEEWGGLKILVKPVSVRMTLELGRNASDPAKLEELFVSAFIECARDPETGERIFSDEDREQVLGLDGGVVARIVQNAQGVEPEQAAKN